VESLEHDEDGVSGAWGGRPRAGPLGRVFIWDTGVARRFPASAFLSAKQMAWGPVAAIDFVTCRDLVAFEFRFCRKHPPKKAPNVTEICYNI